MIFQGSASNSDTQKIADDRVTVRAVSQAAQTLVALQSARAGDATGAGEPTRSAPSAGDGFWKPGMVPGILPIQPK